jgi:hypothetical protein
MQERRYNVANGIGVPMIMSGRVRSLSDQAGQLIHIVHELASPWLPLASVCGRRPRGSSSWDPMTDFAPTCPRCIKKAGEPLKAEEV